MWTYENSVAKIHAMEEKIATLKDTRIKLELLEKCEAALIFLENLKAANFVSHYPIPKYNIWGSVTQMWLTWGGSLDGTPYFEVEIIDLNSYNFLFRSSVHLGYDSTGDRIQDIDYFSRTFKTRLALVCHWLERNSSAESGILSCEEMWSCKNFKESLDFTKGGDAFECKICGKCGVIPWDEK